MSKILRIALIVIFSAVLIYSVTRIVLIQIEYQKADEIYQESREAFHVAENSASPQPTPSGASSSEPEEYFPEAYADIEDLLSVNPDIVGWIWIPNTDINFPLLRADNNQKYLNLSYNLKQTNSGSIFMDYRNSSDLSDGNTIIYGHNMKNGGMFGNLKKFADIDYMKAHSYVYVFTADRILKYRIFAGYKTESTSKSYTMDFSGDISYDDFISYIVNSVGNDLIEAPEKQVPLITLSTCTSVRRTERFVVHAAFVAEKAVQQDESPTA